MRYSFSGSLFCSVFNSSVSKHRHPSVMKTLKVTLLAALFLPAIVLHAEPAAENLAAAQKLADAMGLKQQMSAGFNAMMPMIDQISGKLQLDAAGKTELTGIYKEWFEKDLDQDKLRNNIINLYAETFTVQELDGLREFYHTPLGQKLLKEQPTITQRSAQLGMEETKAKQQLLMSKISAFIEKQKAKAGAGAAAPTPVPAPAPAPKTN
jgi:hypothetical protein